MGRDKEQWEGVLHCRTTRWKSRLREARISRLVTLLCVHSPVYVILLHLYSFRDIRVAMLDNQCLRNIFLTECGSGIGGGLEMLLDEYTWPLVPVVSCRYLCIY